ncbi:MAG: hypothetical protein RR565_01795 [Erysipelothrix sp.]|nr:hypothetical protein [Erysipelothrix inopinata]
MKNNVNKYEEMEALYFEFWNNMEEDQMVLMELSGTFFPGI